MKIKFCGANETTTGSQHLIEVNGKRILLDCGLYQGRRQDSYQVNCCFPHFDPQSIDVVVLSHAHIDHSGNLPNLTSKGFTGNIYATPATRDLCVIMLSDSAHIQEQDIAWLNKDRQRKGEELLEPLYRKIDAERCLRQFVTVDYRRPVPISDGVTLEFYDAGHILGSAQIVLDITDHEDGGKKKRLLFSGDIGRGNNEILRDPQPVEEVDYVIMESTYGGRHHSLPTRGSDRMVADILRKALDRNGKVMIPAFAVERTQQLLYVLHRLYNEEKIERVPVYVDSPLAVGATELYRLHPECFNDEVYSFLFDDEKDPFIFEELKLVRSVSGSRKINEEAGPLIVIAASGMCESGRIRHHLKNGIGNADNTVFFVGYCAANTLGRFILDGNKTVNIFGKPHKVAARIEQLDSFSGHADHSELLSYFHALSGSRKRIFLVHGEAEHSQALQTALCDEHDGDISIPKLGSTVEL